jgi:ribosomal protein L16 Arg81 hydroxylase
MYGMTRPFPLGSDVEDAHAPPTEVLWEGLLDDGDLLYIPRGWWHVATPLDEPTLHLTVGVNNLTGADFLSWLANRVKAAEVVRQDLPHLAGAEALADYGERLKAAVLEGWHTDLIQEYLRHADTTARARPSVVLPWAATPKMLPDGEFRVRWNAVRAARLKADGEQAVSVEALGRRWRFAAEAGPLLRALLTGEEFGLRQLATAGGLDVERVRALLRELAAEGVVVVW